MARCGAARAGSEWSESHRIVERPDRVVEEVEPIVAHLLGRLLRAGQVDGGGLGAAQLGVTPVEAASSLLQGGRPAAAVDKIVVHLVRLP